MDTNAHAATEARQTITRLRAEFEAATGKARRDIADDLDWWIGRAAALTVPAH